MESIGAEEARKRLPEILARSHRNGTVTIVTRHGVPYAAIVPVSQVAREAPELTGLRGSGRGCYGEVAAYVERLRDEW
ncbi:MAG: type II toxin-antitoxin system Phd/YefM family antitoxin [Immundisolibacterales bacterium]|nr:type II toxin-antitoxin system Phd/YefM family antitoxin [Immundisolibacterales bacterium]